MASKSAAVCLRWALLGRLSPRRLPAVNRPLCSSNQEPQKDTTAKVCASNPNHVSSIQQHKVDVQYIRALNINTTLNATLLNISYICIISS